MLTRQVRVWAENEGGEVSQWAAETMAIWQDRGGSTTQWMDNNVMERVWEIAQAMSIINKQSASPEQWNLIIDLCFTQISDLVSERLLGKRYIAYKTNLDGQRLKAARDEFAEVGLCGRKNRLEETTTKKRNLVHVAMYVIAPMLHLLLLMMCRYTR